MPGPLGYNAAYVSGTNTRKKNNYNNTACNCRWTGFHRRPLSSLLSEPSGWNALILVLFYIMFCIGVYLIRKLQADTTIHGWSPPKFLLNQRLRGALAFLFGLLMMTTLAYQLGYFASIQDVRSAGLDEGSSSSLLVTMPGALLGFSMLYILVLAFAVQESVQPGERKARIISLTGPLLVNAMLFFTAAQAIVLVDVLAIEGGLWLWTVTLIVLVLSFSPPRILLQDKYPNKFPALSFTALLLVVSWLIST
jgi:hypothetical protein